MIEFGVTMSAGNREKLTEMADRLESLVRDMRAIVDGGLPPSVADAPRIDLWNIAPVSVPVLRGFVSGHPTLPGKLRAIQTSPVWMMSEEMGLARTSSRWYVINKRAGAFTDEETKASV